MGCVAAFKAAWALGTVGDLRARLNDPALPRAGDQVSVSERATGAIAVIERALRQKR